MHAARGSVHHIRLCVFACANAVCARVHALGVFFLSWGWNGKQRVSCIQRKYPYQVALVDLLKPQTDQNEGLRPGTFVKACVTEGGESVPVQ